MVGGWYARVNGDNINANYVNNNNKRESYNDLFGFHTDLNFNKVWIGGEWLKAASVDKSTAWTAGLGYGNYDIKKQGTWDVKAQYFKQDQNAFIYDSTWNHFYSSDDDAITGYRGSKGWMATVDYALQDNVGLSAYYGFNWKEANGNDKKDLGDFYRAELNYKF